MSASVVGDNTSLCVVCDKSNSTECSICCTEYYAVSNAMPPDKVKLELPCCGKDICSECLCKHTMASASNPKCPHCRQTFLSGHSQQFLVLLSFFDTYCVKCNGSINWHDKSCLNANCADYAKPAFSKNGTKREVKRFHYATFGMRNPATNITTIAEELCLSYGNGPTERTRNFILQDDGNISHVFKDGTVQEWHDNTYKPMWLPFVSSALALYPPRHPHNG